MRRGLFRIGLAAAALAALLVPAAAQAAVEITGIDNSSLPWVRATVRVTDAGAKPTLVVKENGKVVDGASIQPPSGKSAIAVLIDSSQSMAGTPLAVAKQGALAFVSAKNPGDSATVISFGDSPVLAQSLTSNTNQLRSAIAGTSVSAKQGTALYAALQSAVVELSSSPPGSRRFIVVLTDGKDTASDQTLAQVTLAAEKEGVTIYPIGIRSADFDAAALNALAKDTGGTARTNVSTDQIGSAYAEIQKQLGETYVVQYRSLAEGATKLEISASGQSATQTYAANPKPPASSGVLPTALVKSPLGPVAIGLGVFLLVIFGAFQLFRPRPVKPLSMRLAPYDAVVVRDGVFEQRDASMSIVKHLAISTERVFGRMRYWKWVSDTIERAALPIKTAELFYAQLGAGVIAVLISLVFGVPAIVRLLILAAGFAAPLLYVRRAASKRSKAFEDQLPDTLVAMAASLKAGHSFNQALDTIIREGASPTSDEFERASSEIRLGRPSDEALEDIANRVASPNFHFVVTAVNIQRQIGGSLAEILDSVAETVRARQQFKRKVKALTATGRMSAYVLVGLPFGIGLVLEVMNPGYFDPLFNSTLGMILVVGGLISIVIGSLVLKKIVSFKV